MERKIRLRGPNFTVDDNMLLLEVVDRYKHDIENKKTDGSSLRMKQQAWINVAKEFNAITSGHTRTLGSLQHNYKNLKKRFKKRDSDANMAIPDDSIPVTTVIEEHGETSEGWEQVAQTMGVSEIKIEPTQGATEGWELESTPNTEGWEQVAQTIGASQEIQLEPRPGPSTQTDNFDNNRANLKRKYHLLLSKKQNIQDTKTRITATGKFQDLAINKMELVNIQKKIFSLQLIDMKETLAHNRQLRAMELDDMKKRYEHYEMLRKLELNSNKPN